MKQIFVGRLPKLTARDGAVVICAVICTLASGLPAAGARYIAFDPPGSTKTGARSINDKGEISGGYSDTNQICYVRSRSGSFSTFGQTPYPRCSAASINSKGETTGEVGESNAQCMNAGLFHGFVRTSMGRLTPFDPPGSIDTVGLSINTKGQIAGYYFDSAVNCIVHGFLRDPTKAGVFTTIDVKKAGTLPNQGTVARSINAVGMITGYFIDTNGDFLGFYTKSLGAKPGRKCGKGCANPFHVEGATGTDRGTGQAINTNGAITGEYSDSNGAYHGLMRDATGMITKFDDPKAGKGMGQGTLPLSINDGGVIAGDVVDSNGGTHGFLRAADGTFTTFDVTGASPGTTHAYSINNTDRITGTYVDTSSMQHGYVRIR